MPLKALSPDIQKVLRSQVVIHGLPDAIRECMENSVDGSATRINCTVDYPKSSFMIVDNGVGISNRELENVGNRFYTSKVNRLEDLLSNDTYGFRGEALNSLAMISNIKIISKVKCLETPYLMTFYKGDRVLTNAIPIEEYVDELFGRLPLNHIQDSGTIIIITGLFDNVPVRKKLINSNSSKFINDIKEVIFNLAAVNANVSFKLFSSCQIICQAGGSIKSVFKSLYGLTDFEPLSKNSDGKFGINGIIGKSSSYSQKFSFIYLNKRKVIEPSIFKEIGKLFVERENNQAFTNKTVVKYPVFAIKIDGPSSINDLLQDPAKQIMVSADLDRIKSLVLRTFKEYLGFKFSPIKKVQKFNDSVDLAAAKVIFGSNTKVGKVNHTEVLGRFSCSDKNHKKVSKRINVNIKTFGLRSDFKIKKSEHFKEVTKFKLTKDVLKSFKVVSQIDKKFILIKCHEPILFIVDQHACDERIRVERYFKEFTDWVMFNMNNGCRLGEDVESVPLSLTCEEIKIISDYQDNFAIWGISFVIQDDKLTLNKLPEILFEKIKKPEVLQNLLIQHSFDLLEKRKLQFIPSTDQWWNWISSIPNTIVDAINSKACRSSIMFGDSLKFQECEKIINDLGGCYFPFQCAHGRPSVVPLGDLTK